MANVTSRDIYRDHSVPEKVVCWRQGEHIGQSCSAPAQNKVGTSPCTNNGSTTKSTLKNAPSTKFMAPMTSHQVTSTAAPRTCDVTSSSTPMYQHAFNGYCNAQGSSNVSAAFHGMTPGKQPPYPLSNGWRRVTHDTFLTTIDPELLGQSNVELTAKAVGQSELKNRELKMCNACGTEQQITAKLPARYFKIFSPTCGDMKKLRCVITPYTAQHNIQHNANIRHNLYLRQPAVRQKL